jgi:hypothetical protein
MFAFNVMFYVLTAVAMKVTVLWDVKPCGLVRIYQRLDEIRSIQL